MGFGIAFFDERDRAAFVVEENTERCNRLEDYQHDDDDSLTDRHQPVPISRNSKKRAVISSALTVLFFIAKVPHFCTASVHII
jgi:hypothetical protein